MVWVQARRLLRGVDVTFGFKRPAAAVYLSALATFLATAVGHALAKAIIFTKVRRVRGRPSRSAACDPTSQTPVPHSTPTSPAIGSCQR